MNLLKVPPRAGNLTIRAEHPKFYVERAQSSGSAAWRSLPADRCRPHGQCVTDQPVTTRDLPAPVRMKSERRAAAQRWRSRLAVVGMVLSSTSRCTSAITPSADAARRRCRPGGSGSSASGRIPLGSRLALHALLVPPLLALWPCIGRPPRHARRGGDQVLLGSRFRPAARPDTSLGRPRYECTRDRFDPRVVSRSGSSPGRGAVRQATVLTIAWLHGCVRAPLLAPPYARGSTQSPLAPRTALALPVLALLGCPGGRRAAALARRPANPPRLLQQTRASGAAERQTRDAVEWACTVDSPPPSGDAAARAGRRFTCAGGAPFAQYPGGREDRAGGFSILEASRFAQFPHASAAGGAAGCSSAAADPPRCVGPSLRRAPTSGECSSASGSLRACAWRCQRGRPAMWW